MRGFAAWVEATALSAALRGSGTIYMLVNALHILGIAMLVGAILPLDLRLLGLIRHGRIEELAPFLSRAAAVGLFVAMLTGAALWTVRPAEYLGNPAFLWKMGLLVLALINVALQHRSVDWRLPPFGRPPVRVRVFSAVSLISWLAVLLAGRWIGFV